MDNFEQKLETIKSENADLRNISNSLQLKFEEISKVNEELRTSIEDHKLKLTNLEYKIASPAVGSESPSNGLTARLNDLEDRSRRNNL